MISETIVDHVRKMTAIKILFIKYKIEYLFKKIFVNFQAKFQKKKSIQTF